MLLGPSWDCCANIHNRRPPVYDELLSRLSNSQRANGRPVDVFRHDCNTFRHSTREFSQLLTLRRPVFPLEAFVLFLRPLWDAVSSSVVPSFLTAPGGNGGPRSAASPSHTLHRPPPGGPNYFDRRCDLRIPAAAGQWYVHLTLVKSD